MGEDYIPQFTLVSGVFFAAGMVKGLLGMGLPTLAMGLLGLLMPVPQAAGLLILPSLVTNVWQALVGGALRRLAARLWSMQAGIVAGVACAPLLPAHDDHLSRLLLGGCLLAYGLTGLAGWRPASPTPAVQRFAGPAVGMITGAVTAMTGVFVLPAVPYLQSLQLDRRDLAQALGLSFTTSTIALAGLLATRGALGAEHSLLSALVLAPALAGMVAGQKLRDAMSEAAFRRIFFGGLVALGAWLVAA